MATTSKIDIQNPLIGEIKMFAGSTAPAGWLICDGSAISRTVYKNLFNIIGTVFGSGDGSTTFNIPDFRGRTAIGSGTGTASDATAHSLGDMNGEETHKLTVNELAKHTHTWNGYWTVPRWSSGNYCTVRSRDLESGDPEQTTTNNAGKDQPHNNMQPYTTINYIIYMGGAA